MEHLEKLVQVENNELSSALIYWNHYLQHAFFNRRKPGRLRREARQISYQAACRQVLMHRTTFNETNFFSFWALTSNIHSLPQQKEAML